MEYNGERKIGKNRFARVMLKHAPKLIIAGMLMMVTCVLICHISVRKSMIRDYNAVVGRAYADNKEAAKLLADYLYSEKLTEEDVYCGQQAMQEFGYTVNGMQSAKTYDLKIYIAGDMVVLLLFLFNTVIALYQKKGVILAAEEEKIRIKKDILHLNQGERQFLEKKNRQTQNYLENVAHQVRTPLTNMMLNISLLYDEQTEEGQAVLDECSYHAERINRLMERLLKIGRLEAGKIIFERQEENLKDLFEKLVKSYQMKTRIITSLEEVFLNVDYDWLYEAFKCLVDNCLEHIGPENEVSILLKAEDGRIVITVEDNGYGFNEEDIPYLFERFYSSKDAYASKHYGIGLNLAKLIVEGHYGTIKAYNRDSGGAGFRIELPQYKMK